MKEWWSSTGEYFIEKDKCVCYWTDSEGCEVFFCAITKAVNHEPDVEHGLLDQCTYEEIGYIAGNENVGVYHIFDANFNYIGVEKDKVTAMKKIIGFSKF